MLSLAETEIFVLSLFAGLVTGTDKPMDEAKTVDTLVDEGNKLPGTFVEVTEKGLFFACLAILQGLAVQCATRHFFATLTVVRIGLCSQKW